MSSEKNNIKRKISENVVENIKKNGVKMKPPCYFAFSSFIWFALGVIFFVSSLVLLSFSIHYFSEYEILGLLGIGYFSKWFLLPFVIGLVGIFFIYLSSRFYRRGRICCRHEEWMLLSAIGSVVVLSLFILTRSNFYKDLRNSMENYCFNKGFSISSKKFWFNQTEGRIFGEIKDVDKKNGIIFLIKDSSDSLWEIETKNCGCKVNHKNAQEGDLIKVVGEFEDENFSAKEIWLWE